jgi:hypothetical protein
LIVVPAVGFSGGGWYGSSGPCVAP